jgi:hypothetical protein
VGPAGCVDRCFGGGCQLDRDRRLTSYPVIFDLLRTGRCTLRHATTMVRLTRDLDLEDALDVDQAVGGRAATMTVPGFRRIVRKAVARLDRRSAEDRRQARRRHVGVRCYPGDDGLITLAATMPAVDGVAAMVELNRRADLLKHPGGDRSHGERQIEALLAGLRRESPADSAPPPPDAAPATSTRRSWLRAEIGVVIDLSSLLGLTDTPGELAGYGPIPAADIRAMLTEPGTMLRRLVTDPITGVLVDYGRSRYRPDAHLTGLTKARDVTCRYPGCAANALYCDGEHCNPYPTGATSAANLCQVCRRHHLRKTFDHFDYTRPDPATGETIWTTPLGFTYRQAPAGYDDAGPDPGDTQWLDLEQDQRWTPPLPDPPSEAEPDPPPVEQPPPF